MASSTCPNGLILLGNSGTGKSFLANCFLHDDDAFESRISARSVTRKTEWRQMQGKNDHRIYAVANIPGLLEANQSLVDENRKEIMNALAKHPSSVVIYVFGHRNGRIADEDLVAFNAITSAYTFHPDSVLLFINGIPPNHPVDYYEKTNSLVHQLTQMPKDKIYFIEKVTETDGKEDLHRTLHEIIAQTKPYPPNKKQDIVLITDELSHLKRLSKEKQEELLRVTQSEPMSPQPDSSNTKRPAEEETSINMSIDRQLEMANQVIVQNEMEFRHNLKQRREQQFLLANRESEAYAVSEFQLERAEQIKEETKSAARKVDEIEKQSATVVPAKESVGFFKKIKRSGRYIFRLGRGSEDRN